MLSNIREKFAEKLSKVTRSKFSGFIFVVIFLIPVIVISVFFVIGLHSVLINRELDKLEVTIERARSDLSDVFMKAKDLSDRLYVNRQLQNILLTEYKDSDSLYSDYASLKFLEDYLTTYSEIENFKIYTENQTLLDNQFISKTTPVISAQHWYENALIVKGKFFWTFVKDPVSKKTFLSLIRSVWSSGNGSLVGVLVIYVNPEAVKKCIVNNNYKTVLFYDKTVLYSDYEEFSPKQKETLLEKSRLIANQKKYQRIKLDDEEMGVVTATFSPQNFVSLKFTLLYAFPIKVFISTIYSVIFYAVFVILITIILASMAILFFSIYFENHAKFERQQLISRQSEMRFKMLSNQINPHFLFNTLETIRMKSLSNKDREVADMLHLLARLLRYNLSVKGQPVPMLDEVNAIQNYLEIQHTRFGDRITYDVVTLCDIQKMTILPLLIQPIVENSFSHGLENTVSGGFIYILFSTEQKNGREVLCISVRDNGEGMTDETLTALRTKLSEGFEEVYTKSIGLINVVSRIKMFYGEEYGLEIDSQIGKGTEIRIILPVVS